MTKTNKSTKKLLNDAMWGRNAKTITNRKEGCKPTGILKWPNSMGIKQSVDVDVTTWAGWSLGATHYYAKIKVECNKEWCNNCLAWHTPVNLKASKGYGYEASVGSKAEAVKFVDMVIKEFLNDPSRYEIWDEIYETPWDKIKAQLLSGD